MTAKLKIMPLGGLGEVGKNMMSIEYGRNIIVIDAGMMFPESDMLGVDYILPDWEYLRDKKDLLRAILITHGHLDHIGALAHFLQEFDAPVYATRLTRGLIEVKLKRKRMLEQTTLHTYAAGDLINIGPFTIEPYHVCHSIPDTVGLGITTPVGLIVHSGDFKLDHTPVDGWPTDQAKLAEFSDRGVLVLLSDSTNADQPGSTLSEAVLDDAFHQIMREAPGRLIIATFASLISRVQQVVNVAQRHNRKIAIAGRSMIENTTMARELGYLDIPPDILVSLDEIKKLPPRQVIIMATGSQGEPMAVLNRLATGRLSSHTIPGNEEMTYSVINRLFQRGADVYYGPLAQAHVSGHASQEELKLLINMLRPRFFVPIHGELRHLKQHGKMAQQLGIPQKNIAVIENGYPLTFDGKRMEIGERVPGEYVFVDGSLVGEVGPMVMRQRDALSQSGFVTAVARYDSREGKVVGQPRLITRGFVFAPDAEELLSRAGDIVRSVASVKGGTAPDKVEEKVEKALSDFFYRETKRKPVVTAVMVKV
ncbi:MAG: ribonuclease J [Anaerolineaceae bacterium 4572_32.1]|nr:MAG: ribonuclease J [Anaerolineaceae bacterium 4572_32.1]